MGFNRYWRIKYQNVLTGGQTGVNEVSLSETAGGANIATDPAAAIASGSYGGVYAPSSAFDGNPAKDWFQNGGYGYDGNWIGYDFGAGNDKDIHEIKLTSSATSPEGAPCIFYVESSADALIWGFEWMGFHYAAWAALEQFTWTKPTKQVTNAHWGMLSIQTQLGNRDMLLGELHFNETVGGPSQIPDTADYRIQDGNPIYDITSAYDNNPDTGIYAGRAGYANFVRYNYTTPKTMVECFVQATNGGNGNNERCTTIGFIMFGQDGNSWLIGGDISAPSWGVYESRTFPVSIVPTVVRSEQSMNLVVYNIPTVEMRGTAAQELIPYQRETRMEVTQATMMVVQRGRIANPRLRVWTFTLDGHDMFVLRLGDKETLVYDVTTEKWVDWDSSESGAWRANVGLTWIGAQGLAYTYGSSVVAGDDTFGLLWFLDPTQPWDEIPDPTRLPNEIPFTRIVSGQVVATGRQNVPCYAVFVNVDNYGLSAPTITPYVTLEYSDDQGRNFVSAGSLSQNDDLTAQNPYQWLSLGQIQSPGRIFRVTDNGMFSRIDSMEMNDDG